MYLHYSINQLQLTSDDKQQKDLFFDKCILLAVSLLVDGVLQIEAGYIDVLASFKGVGMASSIASC